MHVLVPVIGKRAAQLVRLRIGFADRAMRKTVGLSHYGTIAQLVRAQDS